MNLKMTDVLAGQVRHVITSAGGAGAGVSVVQGNEIAAVVSAVVTLIGFVLSYQSNKK